MLLVYIDKVKFQVTYNRDITQREYEKRRNDCIVFKGIDCINIM